MAGLLGGWATLGGLDSTLLVVMCELHAFQVSRPFSTEFCPLYMLGPCKHGLQLLHEHCIAAKPWPMCVSSLKGRPCMAVTLGDLDHSMHFTAQTAKPRTKKKLGLCIPTSTCPSHGKGINSQMRP